MSIPSFPDDPAFKMLRANEFDAFNRAVAERDKIDFSGADLRGVDFRNVDLSKLVLRDAYLRYVDLRGCDLRHLDLSGVSLHGAKIGGAYFPENVLADDIRMSLRYGTRIRTRSVAEAL